MWRVLVIHGWIWFKSLLLRRFLILFLFPLFILMLSSRILHSFPSLQYSWLEPFLLYTELAILLFMLYPDTVRLRKKLNLSFFPEALLFSIPAALAFLMIFMHGQWKFPLNAIGMPVLILTVFQMLLVSFTEELWFRGILYPLFQPYLSTQTNIIINSAFFAALHLSGGWFQSISAFCLSVVILALYSRNDNLWFCILIHWLTNSLIILCQ